MTPAPVRLHYLQHVPFEGPGIIASWAAERGWQISASHMYAGDLPPAAEDIDWLIIMGGPMNVYQDIEFPWLKREKMFIEQAIAKGKTVLGICLGAQLIADVLGAGVKPNEHREIGWFPVNKTGRVGAPPLASAFPESVDVLHWHGDTFDLPAGAYHLARSQACEHQAFIYENRIVAFQFHMETTAAGLQRLIENCADEIDGSRFVQPPDEMMAEPQRFAAVNLTMRRLLDAMAERTRS